jgi:hypothetical protein
MNITGITGIAPEIIAELKKGQPRTLELITAQNVVSAATVSVSDRIFITSVPQEDVSPGDSGILVQTLATSITMQRISGAVHGAYYEERERLSVRLQVKYSCTSHVRVVVRRGHCEPFQVDVAECVLHRVR